MEEKPGTIMFEDMPLHKRNSIYIALFVGGFWMLSSFLPLPQMLVLNIMDGIVESVGIESRAMKNAIYATGVLMLAITFNLTFSKTVMVLSAIGVTFFMTPIFAYYEDILPQEPYFLPVFLCGIAVILVLGLAGYLKKVPDISS